MRRFVDAIGLGVFLTVFSAIAQAQPVVDGLTVITEQDGQRFICSLTIGDGVAVSDVCLPLVTPEQADRMAELSARVAELTTALTAAEAEAVAQGMRADSAEATATEALAQQGALTKKLELTLLEVQALRAQLEPFLAANAEAASDAAVLDQAIALEQGVVNIGLLSEERIAPLTVAALQGVMEELGERCTLSLATIQERGGEEWLQRVTYAKMFAALEIPQETAALILSYSFDALNDKAAPRTVFTLAYQNASDEAVSVKGSYARDLLRRNMDRLNSTVEKVLRDPAYIALAADKKSVALVGCQ